MISELPKNARYSLDTGCLINGWQHHYPPDMFAPVWDHLDQLIESGIVVASAEVLFELERQDDEVHAWAKQRNHMFLDLIVPLQDQVSYLMKNYPKLVSTGRNRADPFVVGLARLRDDPLTVVTEETRFRAGPNKPKIPFICDQEGIPCVSLVKLLRDTGWRLSP